MPAMGTIDPSPKNARGCHTCGARSARRSTRPWPNAPQAPSYLKVVGLEARRRRPPALPKVEQCRAGAPLDWNGKDLELLSRDGQAPTEGAVPAPSLLRVPRTHPRNLAAGRRRGACST